VAHGRRQGHCCDLLPPPCCFGTASSLCFLCSLCQQRSSLSTVASWRCWCCWRLVAVSWLTGRRLQAAAEVLLFQCYPMILPICFPQAFNSSFLSLCFGLFLSPFFSVFPFSPFGSFSPPFSLFFLFLLSGLSLPSPSVIAAVLVVIYRAK